MYIDYQCITLSKSWIELTRNHSNKFTHAIPEVFTGKNLQMRHLFEAFIPIKIERVDFFINDLFVTDEPTCRQEDLKINIFMYLY